MKATKNRILACFMAVGMLFSSVGALAENDDASLSASFAVSVTETDSAVGISLSLDNTKLRGLQTAIRYNPEVLTPVDKDGETANDFADFAKKGAETNAFTSIGKFLDKEQGLFGFTLYIMPDADAEGIDENGCVTITEQTEFYSFTFKRIAEGEPQIEVAVAEEGKVSQGVLTEGLIVLDENGSLTTTVRYSYNNETKKSEVIEPTKDEAEPTGKPATDKPASAPEIDEDETTLELMTSDERKKDVICLMIDRNMTITYGDKKVIDEESPEVVPYITNDRTMVPLRFISEALGAEVLWEEGWDGCIIKKGDDEIKFTFGSAEFEVNGKKMTYDAPIEMVANRTMVPIRFFSEQLGCDVYWEEINRAVIIAPIDNPWVPDREAEITAVNEMLLTILAIL